MEILRNRYENSSDQVMAVSMLILRIVALLLLTASTALLVTIKFTNSTGRDATTFKYIGSYRFVLATVVGGLAYGLVQLPLAIHYACKEERMSSSRFRQQFDFYGDKVISLFLATGVVAGFAVGFESKRSVFWFSASLVSANDETKWWGSLDRGNVATGLLLLGSVCVFVSSALSSIGMANGEADSYWWPGKSVGNAKTLVPFAARVIAGIVCNDQVTS